MTKSSQRHFLVRVSGIDGNFDTMSGGAIAAGVTKAWDGGANVPDLIPAPPEAANVVVGRNYDHDRDAPIISALRQRVGRHMATLSITPTNWDLEAIGDPKTFPNALLVGITEPDYDSSSGDTATWQLEWATAAVR